LVALLNSPKAPNTINILAQSVGNRLVAEALDYLGSTRLPTRNTIGQVIFAAPDIDSGTFFEMVPIIASVAVGLTMYGRSHYEALRLSRGLHGHCLAGLVGCDYDVPSISNFNAIDTSIFYCA
jgi:esterase/lipase superfamily enzyme